MNRKKNGVRVAAVVAEAVAVEAAEIKQENEVLTSRDATTSRLTTTKSKPRTRTSQLVADVETESDEDDLAKKNARVG